MQVFKLNKLYSQLKTFCEIIQTQTSTKEHGCYLPQVTNNWSICPGVFCIQSHGAILENYQVKGFIKPPEKNNEQNEFMQHIYTISDQFHSVPPVVALSMEKGLGVTVQRLDFVGGIVTLLGFIKGYDKSSLFYGIQRQLVLTTAEVRVASLCPRRPTENRKCITKKLDISL